MPTTGIEAPVLSADEIATFRTRGFHAVARITADDEVIQLREIYDRLLVLDGTPRLEYEDVDAPEGARPRIDQIFVPDLFAPELRDTTYLANALVLAAQLLAIEPADVQNGGMMLISKPAGLGLETPFHQDEAYWDFEGTRLSHSVSVWMPLDDVSVDSGCMQFVPGTHATDDVRIHRKRPSLPLVLDDPIDASLAVPCPLAAGGATAHHCRTVHGTAGNTSERPRRAITTIFHGPPGVRTVPLERPWLA